MSTMGFLQMGSEHKIKLPTPEYHSLTVGETGAGKTVSILYNIIKYEVKNAGCLIVDEKNTMHHFVKHILGYDLLNVYQLGNSIANGKNDIGINLLELACGSKKSTQEFFDLLVDLDSETGSSHRFWAQSASEMIQDIYMFLNSIKKFLQFLEKHTINGVCEFEKVINIDGETDAIVKVKFKITSLPLTLRELAIYFQDKKQFIAICEKGGFIVRFIKQLFPLDAVEKLKDVELVKLNTLYHEMIQASIKIGNHTIPYDNFEASGVKGVYFTACSHINIGLSDLEYLNIPRPKFDIIGLLENGNHIIINSESLPTIATNIITSRILELLTLRAKRQIPKYIAFVADEASRILNKKSDMDRILAFGRESGVRVHIATQAESQLMELFGILKYNSMKENFGDMYFLSSDKYPLKKFAYYSKKENIIYESVPCFVEQEKLYEAEKNYQIATGQYSDVAIEKDEIIIYDARLYEEKNLLIAINIVTLEEREVEYVKVENDMQGYFKKLRKIDSNNDLFTVN